MKPSSGSVILWLLIGGIISAAADTITLTDGSQLEGRIIEETSTDYTLEVQVTASIKDRRQVSKSDVASVRKTAAWETAYREIRAAIPLPDNASLADYDAVLDEKIAPFLKNHPSAPEAKEVKELRDRLTEERNAIGGGGAKIGGRLYSGSERRANAYDLDALALWHEMERNAQQGAFVAALRNFERMELEFSGSSHFRDAVNLARRVLPAFRREVEAEIQRVPARLEERKIGLARLPAEEQARASSLIEEEDRVYQAQLAEAKSTTKWPRLSPFHVAPMEQTLRTIDSETKRLEQLDLTKLPDAGAAFRQAWVAASSGNRADAEKALTSLKSMRLPQRYLDAIEKRASAPREQPSEMAAQEETPGEVAADEAPADTEAGEPNASPTDGRH